jgi:hypothetical protein
MNPIAALIFADDAPPDPALLDGLHNHPLIEKVIFLRKPDAAAAGTHISVAEAFPLGGFALEQALEKVQPCPFVLIIPKPRSVRIFKEGIEGLLQRALEADAGLCYADYYEESQAPAQVRETIDYQPGSIRDDFFFGPLMLFKKEALDAARQQYGPLQDTRWGGLYELRLRISRSTGVARIPEPLSIAAKDFRREVTKSLFDYVDPAHVSFQQEMEGLATAHLKDIGAYVKPSCRTVPHDASVYPVEASVVIPVRNREKTIADAITSALGQNTAFPFNVIVVQNHSTDKTGERVEELAQKDMRVVHIIPERTDLGIGGCWNEAVMSPRCGRYVCQLDSDDLYADDSTLSTVIAMLQEGPYGMVVGTYRVVNFSLQEIPPGLVEHREWTEENGRNNLLRVHGIGAPRAFPASLLRKYPFPNVSYGEDYAVALRISREYRVGRIFKPLYLCRRWEGNSDANLSHEQENRYAYYKDGLRTQEIQKRIAAAVAGKGVT